MSQGQAFGNYQKRKFIKSPKKSFYSPKGRRKNVFWKTPTKEDAGDDNAIDNTQTSIFKYFSPTSESKRRKLTPENIGTNHKKFSPNTTNFRRALFYSKDEKIIINISDDEDDENDENEDVTKFVLHIKAAKKHNNQRIVPVTIKTPEICNQDDDLLFSESCVKLLDQTKKKTSTTEVIQCGQIKREVANENLPQEESEVMVENLSTESSENVRVEIKSETANENSGDCVVHQSNQIKAETADGDLSNDSIIYLCDYVKSEKAHASLSTDSIVILSDEIKSEIVDKDLPTNTEDNAKNEGDQFHKVDEIVSLNSPCKTSNKTKVKSENLEVTNKLNVEISPTKSVISSDEVVSLVSDVDWWDDSDFEDQVKTPIKSVDKNKPDSVSNKLENLIESKNKEPIVENSLQIIKVNKSPKNKNADSQLATNSDTMTTTGQLNDNQQNVNLESDTLYYILTSPPAKIAWNTIFLHSQYQNLYKNYISLSNEEKRLYSRLFKRKYDWIRLENIKYDFVADLNISLKNLAKVGFVKFLEPESEDLSVVINLMLLDEVKKACDLLLINKKGKKSDMVESILKSLKSQPALNFGKVNPLNKRKMQVVKILPKCIKLEDNPRNLFMSFLLISTYPQYKSRDDDRLTILIDLLYKLNSGLVRELGVTLTATQMFKSLAKFRDYEESVNLVDKLLEAKKEKKWDQATILLLQAKTELILYLKNPDIISELDEMADYMRKYTPGSNYAYALNEGIEVLKKDKTNTGISEAVECLVLLLSQNYFQKGRRASWHCELALMMERWKKFDEVFLTLKQGLLEASLTPLGKLMLAQRCEILLKRKQGLTVPQKTELAQLSEIKPYRFSTNTIPAKAMPNVATNKKQMWTKVTETGRTYMGVEEVVRQYYMSAEGGAYTEGYHDEGSIIINLALCVFWKIIYAPLEGMFHVRLQDRPLDWGSSAFYRNRIKLIHSHIQHLLSNGINSVMEEITDVCTKHTRTLSMISWDLIKLEQLPEIKKFLECVGIEPFLKFCDYLLQAYKERSSGLPDLTLWDVNKNKCLFVEVKGPSDKLSPKQIIWLQILNEVGIESEVCHVHTLHTGKREISNETE